MWAPFQKPDAVLTLFYCFGEQKIVFVNIRVDFIFRHLEEITIGSLHKPPLLPMPALLINV